VEQEKQFMTSRILRVARKVQETSNTLSVYLAAADAKPLQPFNAGQFLEFEIPDVGVRAYLLSAFSAQPKIYRITVKHRPGNEDLAASGATYWRRTAAQGDAVKAYGPTGSFGLWQPLERPVVLIAAAAGEASLTAIAEQLAVRAPRHPVWFVHQTINSSTFALRAKLGSLRADLPNAKWSIWYRDPLPVDRRGKDYDHSGEIDFSQLAHPLPWDESEFHVCGPDDFVARIAGHLQRLGVTAARVHMQGTGAEEFQAAVSEEAYPVLPTLAPRQVSFVRSGITAIWKPDDGSLLEFAERLGLAAAYSCRTGMCGTCAQRIISGNAVPTGEIIARPHPGFQLMCSSVPLSDLEIDL
jgi:ferredoxin-NADP reductase